MGTARRARRIARLIQAIAARRQGASIRQLMESTGASRPTLYRDLELVRESGYGLRAATVGGEARYFVEGSELAQRALSPREHATAALARHALLPLAGTAPVQTLEQLLLRARGTPMAPLHIEIARPASHAHPDVLKTLQAAAAEGRVLSIRYRGAKDAQAKPRRVQPIKLQVVDGTPYLSAWDEGSRAVRTFRASRISVARKLRDKCRIPKGAEEPADPRARSVKVWSGAAFDVRIRIAAPAARFAGEWPLTSDQSLEPGPAGTLDVCARVYGLEETLRWTLRWGRNAEALEPAELRKRVAEELSAALAGYRAARARERASKWKAQR